MQEHLKSSGQSLHRQCPRYYTILITDIRPEQNSHLSDGLGSKHFLSNSEREENGSKCSFPILMSSIPVAEQMEEPATSRAEERDCFLSAACAGLIRCCSSGGQEAENDREAEISH